MFTRRRVLILMLVIAVVGLAGYAGWLVTRPVGINLQGFELIRVGMTEVEVERILGEPPSDYVVGAVPEASVLILPEHKAFEHSRMKNWDSPQATVWVYFRPNGTVIDKAFAGQATEPTLLDRIRAWLGW